MSLPPSNDAINGTAFIDLLSDENALVQPAAVAVSWDQKVTSHDAFATLSGKKLFKLDQKRDVLKQFLSITTSDVFDRELCDNESPLMKTMESLRVSGKTPSSIKQNWNAAFVADKLIRLKLFAEESDRRKASRSGGRKGRIPTPLKVLNDMVETAAKEGRAEADASAKKKPRSATISQKSGEREQDKVPFREQDREHEPCPLCQHSYCMAIDTQAEVNAKNATIVAGNKDRLDSWQKNGQKGFKPKNKGTVCQRIACYCYRMTCLCQSSGQGCPQCVEFRQLGETFLAKNARGLLECECAVCKCPCDTVFPRNKRQQVALEAETKKRAANQQQQGEFSIVLD
jgi:hypothetical protein